ncbi:MAG TPA: hypothetical protein VG963_01355 [Polyangiaceae bacterium]|nr:hypothetical protein [Polyangiaceae bacterium]
MANSRGQQGTGKHPHKDTQEPWSHPRKADASAGEKKESGGSAQEGGKKQSSSDLKEREYRDSQGNVHHHTRTYEEQHGKQK